MNICASTKLVGLDGLSIDHIGHQIYMKETKITPHRVFENSSYGFMEVPTKYGGLVLSYRESGNWLKSLELIEIIPAESEVK